MPEIQIFLSPAYFEGKGRKRKEMETWLTTNLTEVNKNIRYAGFALLAGSVVVGGFLAFLRNLIHFSEAVAPIVGGVLFVSGLIMFVVQAFAWKVVGNIRFDEEGISVQYKGEKVRAKYQELQSLKVDYSGYKGEGFGKNERNGHNNILSLQKGGKRLKLGMYLENEGATTRLIQILNQLNRMQVSVQFVDRSGSFGWMK